MNPNVSASFLLIKVGLCFLVELVLRKMVNGSKVEFWTDVCFASRWNLDGVRKLIEDLISMCKAKGMLWFSHSTLWSVLQSDFNPMPSLVPCIVRPNQSERTLIDIHQQYEARLTGKQLQRLIVILPNTTKSYGTIKIQACVQIWESYPNVVSPNKLHWPTINNILNMWLWRSR